MHPTLYLAFILATTILILIPGPNVALIVANSIAHGTRFGLLPVAGTSAAMIIQLTLTALGLTEMLANLAHWFSLLRWIGVIYLFYLGITQWLAAPVDLTRSPPQPKSPRALFLPRFLVSPTHPQTPLFF